MDSQDLAGYIEVTGGQGKPWLLAQLRLKKLQEQRAEISASEYVQRIADIQQDLNQVGEWWVGIEDEVFGG